MTVRLKQELSGIQKKLKSRRRDLIAHRGELVGNLSELTESQFTEGTLSNHPADEASDMFGAEQVALDIRRIEEQIEDIDGALDRIEEGSYGVCIDCGESVDPARLEARPTAKRCLRCQIRHEQTRRPLRE